MTFSVLLGDPSGEWGMAIATARSAVGGRCVFLSAGGVVASQGMVDSGLGYRVARALGDGVGPEQAIGHAVGSDPERVRRQVLAVDSSGRSAGWTGESVPDASGQETGDGFAIGGNLLAGPDTLAAMDEARAASSGDLLERLLRVLAAGQAAGGDRRGRQSAAVVVGDARGWPTVDLRVDDHQDPITELERLATLWRREWGEYDRTGVFPEARPPGPPPKQA